MRYICAVSWIFLVGCEDSPVWRDPDQHVKEEGRYCYPTLGGVDCYTRPLKRCSRELVGYEGPPPPQEVYE